jgi:hypothetical protein
MSMAYLPYLAALALAAAAGRALPGLATWAVSGRPPEWIADALQRRNDRLHPATTEMPSVLLQLELSRLALSVQQVENSDPYGRALRLRAIRSAYDDVLVRCCHSMGIEAPEGPRPLSDQQRFDAEQALIGAGVEW